MRKLPRLQLARISTATTYHFSIVGRDLGWALATVNDETGELDVHSAWGKWSYRWDARPSNLGAPTLTHFIAKRGGCDYLADKLWGGGYGGSRFSPAETVKAFRKRLAEKRLEEGRHHLRLASYGYGYGRAGVFIDAMDEGACSVSARKRRYYDHQTDFEGEPLTKGIAREIWDALDELDDAHLSGELFLERLYRISGHAWLGEELWDSLESEQYPMYTVLLKSILPALRDACAERIKPPAVQEQRNV